MCYVLAFSEHNLILFTTSLSLRVLERFERHLNRRKETPVIIYNQVEKEEDSLERGELQHGEIHLYFFTQFTGLKHTESSTIVILKTCD